MSDSTRERILDATLRVLARRGVAGVSMRAVAREADVAIGLTNYHFENKIRLISAALERIGDTDMELVAQDDTAPPADRLRRALQRALDPAFLTDDYLSLRLQLWSLAGVDETFGEINRAAQRRYLAGLADLVAAARPDLYRQQAERRAIDILTEQNGVWLTAVLIPDESAVARALERTEALAFG